jgi:hypothetical protein
MVEQASACRSPTCCRLMKLTNVIRQWWQAFPPVAPTGRGGRLLPATTDEYRIKLVLFISLLHREVTR